MDLEDTATSAEDANSRTARGAVAALDLASTTPTSKANKDLCDAANNIIMAAEVLHKAAMVIKKIAVSESVVRVNLPDGQTWTLSEISGTKEGKDNHRDHHHN